MHFEDLANELVLHIFQSCASVPDVLNLAATCHHFRKVLTPSRRLPILFQAAEAQLGPLPDAIQLVTHNTSQAVHVPRASPPLSLALLTRLLSVGRVANQWAAVYPTRKWRGPNSSFRRLLSSMESYRLRRALYRLWLFTLAFHSPLHPRTTRQSPPIIRSRAALLRAWPSHQLAEMLDLHAIFRDVLAFQVCPSNSTALRRHRARFPDDPAPVLIHARLSSQHLHDGHSAHLMRHHQNVSAQEHFHGTIPLRSVSSDKHHPNGCSDAAEGWGDEIGHYYVVEDMLKLDPGQLLFLYESVMTGAVPSPTTTTARKSGYAAAMIFNGKGGVVERFAAGLGDWFENNGETFGETLDWVVEARGEDTAALREEVRSGANGIVRKEETEEGETEERWDGE
ncbi:hypothetical protein MMC29_004747 [Sticta canariensis]|nr:hypothetical protein [Sticta canariensis]